MGQGKKMRSDQYTTSGLGGANWLITVDAVTPDQILVNPATGINLPGRTTIEIHNNGAELCYIFFHGMTPTDGRILNAGEYVAFALTEKATLAAQASATTVDLRITEII